MEFSQTIRRTGAIKVLNFLCLLLTGFLLLTLATPSLSGSCSTNAGGGVCGALNDVGSSPNPLQDITPRQIGNTVDIATGNNYQGALDFKTADSFLSFKRHYNSVNAGFNLGLGAGWRSTYDVSLNYHDANNLQIIQSDGRIIAFQATQQSGSGKSNSGKAMRFEPEIPSDGYIIRHGAHHSWQLPDKRVLNFKGRFLTHIDFGTGHNLKLFYKNQRLSTVTDEVGRQIQYHYTEGNGLGTYQPDSTYTNHPGHLEKIRLPDDSAIEFFYDKRRNLRKVVRSDESTMEYDYQDGLYPGILISSAKDRFVQSTWQYHSDGTVASFTDRKNALAMEFSYHDNRNNPLA